MRKFVIKVKMTIGPGEREPFWHRIGIGTEMDNGTILISIASIPINWNGEAKMFPEEAGEPRKPAQYYEGGWSEGRTDTRLPYEKEKIK